MEDKIRAGSVLRGRYRILHPLGEGGFGVTYKAVDQDTFDSPCVVKRLRPLSTDPYTLATARKLFEREAKVLNRLNHFDQVPRLLAHFEQDQDFYLVQEFVAGHDLSQELIPGKPLSEAEVLKLLWDILEILRHVHAHQIVHRDIKPANLMRRDADGKLVLIDFGAVKEVGRLVSHAPGQTQLATVIGSVGYMAPEQLNGKPQPCSDLYSVGVLAIQALTGRPPHKIRDDPRTGQLLWRDLVQVSEELAEILDRLICPHWQERFQSAAEVLEALRPLLPFPQEATLGDVSVDQVLVTRLLARAQEKARQGDFQGAIADCTLAIQLDPQNSRAYSQRGSARYKSGDLAGAIADYTQVIQLAGDARAYFNRGIARYRLEDYEGAVADYTQALGLNPQWAVAYYNRGNAYRQLNQQQQAIEDYSRAIELNPEDVRAYFNRGVVRGHLGDAQGAAADFSEVIKRDPQDGEAYFNRGVARVQLSDLQGAVEDYTQALQLDPRHGKAYYHRGLARQALGDPQGAVEDFSQAISLRSAEATELPEAEAAAQADLYLQRAMAYLSSNTLEPALADCEQALRLDPNLSRAYLCRGLARQGLGDPGGALADFNRALELDPQMAKAYLNRGIAHLDLGNIEAALSDLNQAIALDPQDASAYSSRGRIHWLLGDPLAALQDYTAALERDPQNPQLYLNRGQLHVEREDWPAACEDFSQVLQWAARPGIPRGPELLLNAHLCRGMARQRLGDLAGALADFTALIQQQPQASQAFALRARVHLALGDQEVALADLNQALSLDQNWGVADAALAYRQRGDLHRQANCPELAIADYTQALALNPQEHSALLHRALLWDGEGQTDKAIEDYTRLLQLELDPQERVWVLNNRGWAYAQQGDFSAAIRDYDQAITLCTADASDRDPCHLKAHFNRALARAALGDWQRACQDFQAALQMQGYEGRLLEDVIASYFKIG
jgi:tetratricopeptide (TPR) repeat protein/tRNA A-37 threonylcarbamoyl transferase component Bud32